MTIRNKLIGITGLAGSGKDTFANFLLQKLTKEAHEVELYAFADPLKEVCSILFNVDIARFYDHEHKECIIDEWNMTPRTMMQLVGTDLVRRCISDEFWIDRARSELKISSDIFIVTDVRYENEAKFIRDNGGQLYHVLRKDIKKTEHSSEQGIDLYDRDIIVYNNGTLEDIKNQVPDFG